MLIDKSVSNISPLNSANKGLPQGKQIEVRQAKLILEKWYYILSGKTAIAVS